MRSKRNSGARGAGRGTVRIIGGEWRGRRLPIPAAPGLRPSGDRTRETLFNWLQPHLRGARAADLFAGTGALGLEAVSRGAAEVVLVDPSALAAKGLRDSVVALDAADRARVVEEDALAWLARQPPDSLDLVFVDPPFDAGLLQPALDALAAGRMLTAGALIYVESARAAPPPAPAEGWIGRRESVLGEVRMQLFEKFALRCKQFTSGRVT